MICKYKTHFIGTKFKNCLSFYENQLNAAINTVAKQAEIEYEYIEYFNIVSPNLKNKTYECLTELFKLFPSVKTFKTIEDANQYFNNTLCNQIDHYYAVLESFITEDFITTMNDLEYSLAYDYDTIDNDTQYQDAEEALTILKHYSEQNLQFYFYCYAIKYYIDIINAFYPDWNFQINFNIEK